HRDRVKPASLRPEPNGSWKQRERVASSGRTARDRKFNIHHWMTKRIEVREFIVRCLVCSGAQLNVHRAAGMTDSVV
uniref:Uncharacterized protein n=1 Tax=Anopheles dirus TaxID=7168 RepID=A0A182NLL7_9DIPT